MARTVLITGTSRGIGLGLCDYFLKKGDTVVATARDPQRSDKLEQLRRVCTDRCHIVTLDVGDAASVAKLPAALKNFPTIDILINNAGVYLDDGQTFEELSYEMVERTWETNTLGPMRVTAAVLPLLQKSSKPIIANITSKMGSLSDNTSGGYYAYRMSKAALNMFNRSFAVDHPKITSVVLHPGWVQTDMGGSNAAVKVDDSVTGLAQVIEKLKSSDNGKFFDYRGMEVAWQETSNSRLQIPSLFPFLNT